MMTWIWCGIMLLALIIEVVTVGNLITIWFSVGALIALICSLLNASIAIQIIVFALVSATLIILIRPIANRFLRGDVEATNADRIINQHLRLTKGITEDAWGELRFNGTIWSAVSYDGNPINEGTLVTVLTIEGAKVIVKAIG